MDTYSVRDAFQLLKERGIARDKQEVRKWLNEGMIHANPPINRRVGWKIEAEALQTFIRKYEEGAFKALETRKRALAKSTLAKHWTDRLADEPSTPFVNDPVVIRLEEDVTTLRQQVKTLRRELNDLKKVLGFPLLTNAADAWKESNL
ncbi:hypothetical protein MO973_20905 [Paenibacillus sp. TRM 82003]|nr:hypothetical protein [Paenibacillus sp. TRM 82003]